MDSVSSKISSLFVEMFFVAERRRGPELVTSWHSCGWGTIVPGPLKSVKNGDGRKEVQFFAANRRSAGLYPQEMRLWTSVLLGSRDSCSGEL